MMHEDPDNTRVLREMPPRHLNWYTRLVVLFGDYTMQAGWFLLAFGSVFFWSTSIRSEAARWLEQQGTDWQRQPGVVLKADSVNVWEKGHHVWKYEYSFALAGKEYRGVSYSPEKKFDPQQIVYIHYDPANPDINYIIGLRRSPYPAYINLLLIIPLLGLLIVLLPLRQRLRFLHILRVGDFTRGRLISKSPTGKSIREGSRVMPQHKYLFQFEHDGVTYTASCTTHRGYLVEDEEAEIILYDHFKPQNNIVYDAVPNVPEIDLAGRMAPPPASKAWTVFLPVFTVTFNLFFFVKSLLDWLL